MSSDWTDPADERFSWLSLIRSSESTVIDLDTVDRSHHHRSEHAVNAPLSTLRECREAVGGMGVSVVVVVV